MATPSASVDRTHTGGYRNADQDHVYHHELGVVVCPVASRTAGHRLIRLHGGVATRTVKWSASRRGNPPIVPSSRDTTGDTLLSTTVVPSLPVPSQDNRGYDWTISGEYVYVQNSPRVAGVDPLPVGQHPFVCVNQSREGAQWVGSSLSAYAQTADWAVLVETLANKVKTRPDGSYTWPFLAVPTMFFSNHLIRD